MNKNELIDFISAEADLTKVSATRALDAVWKGIIQSLKKGGPAMTGLGTLTVRQRAAREGRNPSTGEKMQIKATKVIGFKASKALKDAVKEEAKSE